MIKMTILSIAKVFFFVYSTFVFVYSLFYTRTTKKSFLLQINSPVFPLHIILTFSQHLTDADIDVNIISFLQCYHKARTEL